jgi:hypothetical protein
MTLQMKGSSTTKNLVDFTTVDRSKVCTTQDHTLGTFNSNSNKVGEIAGTSKNVEKLRRRMEIAPEVSEDGVMSPSRAIGRIKRKR